MLMPASNPQKHTLDLAANNNGVLDDPINLSRALLEELAENVRTGIISRTDDCRKWMRETFDNADTVQVVHGFVDRVRNMLRGVGSRTPSLPAVLRHIDTREALAEQRRQKQEERNGREAALSSTLGVDIRTKMPELNDFLAHGERGKVDFRVFSDALAKQLAELHDSHPEAFGRISTILVERCREILAWYASGHFGLEGIFHIFNAVARSSAVDTVSMQLLGRDLKESIPQQGLARDRLNNLQSFALATSQHVPAWRKKETAQGRGG